MQIAKLPVRKLFTPPALSLLLLIVIIFQSCKKTDEAVAARNNEAESKRPPKNPPPAPTFYFTDCNNPPNSGTFSIGVPVTVNTTDPLPTLNVPAGAEMVIPFTAVVKAS